MKFDDKITKLVDDNNKKNYETNYHLDIRAGALEKKYLQGNENIIDIIKNAMSAFENKVSVLDNKINLLESDIKNEIQKSEKSYGESKRGFEISASLYNAMVQLMSEFEVSLLKDNSEKSVQVNENFAKLLMKNKWNLIDKFYKEPCKINCTICEYEFDLEENEKLISEDIYGGGKLIRYKCPSCGVVFGPLKMLDLSVQELAEEYKMHYSLYTEGDTTKAEIETFYNLNPQKNRKYLNYGCGAWSESIGELREAGYDVWGYDPYAPIDSEYIYNNIKQIRTNDFDGIFSHDLLEHLKNPISEFENFNKILKSGGIMAHATACYKYVYEYTRFHLFFYTGNSIEKICDKVNFTLKDKIERPNDLYYCYVFQK